MFIHQNTQDNTDAYIWKVTLKVAKLQHKQVFWEAIYKKKHHLILQQLPSNEIIQLYQSYYYCQRSPINHGKSEKMNVDHLQRQSQTSAILVLCSPIMVIIANGKQNDVPQ